jgi:phage/plasmid primase-like uncharacterized protein
MKFHSDCAMTDALSFARAVPIERIVDERGIKLRGRVERIGPCPICGGTDRFSVNVKKQVFNCRGCNIGGDVIALAMFLDGCDFRTACTILTGDKASVERGDLRRVVDREHIECEQRRREQEARDDERRRLQWAGRIWNEGIPIAGTAGEIYLAGRGIELAAVPEGGGLRFHWNCPWGADIRPCIVSRFTDAVTGEAKGIHARPITGEKPKALGPMAGCVIRLWPDDEVSERLVIGEGVETVLAAATRLTHRGTLLTPAWAAATAGNLASFPVLPGIEALTILVDNDASGTGQRAAEQCARRWCDAGREVVRLMPGAVGDDFNDLVIP